MGLQGRDYIREVERPLEDVGDVGQLPGSTPSPPAVVRGALDQWIGACTGLEKRVKELEQELADAKLLKLKELQQANATLRMVNQELHNAILKRPEVAEIVENLMCVMIALARIPCDVTCPTAEKNRAIADLAMRYAQAAFLGCGSREMYPAYRISSEMALREFYDVCNKR